MDTKYEVCVKDINLVNKKKYLGIFLLMANFRKKVFLVTSFYKFFELRFLKKVDEPELT